MESKPDSFSIVFPCYNDAGTIGSLIASAHNFARRYTGDFEIIVVDDGSTDQSRTVLLELQERFPALRPIFHDTNQGYGGALRSGFSAARGELIFYTDGDGQYDPSEFALLFAALRDDVQVVNGYKIWRSDPLHRIIVGKIYQHFVRYWFSLPIRDIDCDFRLIRRSAFERIQLVHKSGVICVEMVKKLQIAGCRFLEVGVSHHFRLHGRSQFFNCRRVARALWDLTGLWAQLVWWRNSRLWFFRIRNRVYGLLQPVRK
ncbi:MAG: glycosyltransferase family 2 protein [Acidobacteria bacterium]|nr:glycosyltransferase family 2 protein [Acidobacteriota bacterium]